MNATVPARTPSTAATTTPEATRDPNVETILDPRDPRHGLNDAQAAAVAHEGGPLVVLAGAGSGKTRVIERRVRMLLSRGVRPDAMLLLTFTKRAAAEMRERIGAASPHGAEVLATTFHAFAYQAVRELYPDLGYERAPIVIDQDDQQRLLRDLARRHATSDEEPLQGRALREIHEQRRNLGLELDAAIAKVDPRLREHGDAIRDLLGMYEDAKREHQLLDFADLMRHLRTLLREERSAARIHGRFEHVMIDEYQDVNEIQAEIAWLLAPHGNLMLVGDQDQSIYAFRGSRWDYLVRAVQRPEVTTHTLDVNYRSHQAILDTANALLADMPHDHHKRLRSHDGEAGSPPSAALLRDARHEARYVAERIQGAIARGESPNDIAVLYRASHLGIPLQAALLRAGIRFRTYGGNSLTSTAHVRDVIGFLRMLLNPEDQLAVRRSLELHRGIGGKTAREIAERLTFDAPNELRTMDKPGWRGVQESCEALAELIERAWTASGLPGLIDAILDYYQPLMEHRYEDADKRVRDLDSFREIAHGYQDATALISDLMLDAPSGDDADEASQEPRVTLSTIHAAKGLEWPLVVLYAASDDHLPLRRSIEEDGEDALHEERRLAYVAVTRAQRRLMISYTPSAPANGTDPPRSEGRSEATLSRYLQGRVQHYDLREQAEGVARPKTGRARRA